MSKRIKRVISILSVVFTLSGASGLNNFDFFTKVAYASGYEFTDIKLETTGGSDISLYENNNYTKELNSTKSIKDTYYAKLSSDTSKIVFRTSGTSGVVKIFKDHSSKVYDEGTDIPVLTGKTTFHIRIYDTYDETTPNAYKSDYRVIIKRYTSAEEQQIRNDDQGYIYLQKLELDYGDIQIGFDKLKTTYNAKVDADVKSIAIKAEPEDGATTVKINNIAVDENDDYKKMVSLNTGDNAIKISLSQDYEDDRVYTININRPEKSDSSVANANQNGAAGNTETTNTAASNTNIENNVINDKNPNKWVKVSDKWRYNDGYGNSIKSTWYYDSGYGKNYYFDSSGNMVTGWINLNNNWYYLNSSGAMEIGWKQISGNWYYLDYDGKMKTGWFKDSNGTWYYLYESTGAMAHDTTIGGYRIGSNGTWKK